MIVQLQNKFVLFTPLVIYRAAMLPLDKWEQVAFWDMGEGSVVDGLLVRGFPKGRQVWAIHRWTYSDGRTAVAYAASVGETVRNGCCFARCNQATLWAKPADNLGLEIAC
jgi:hypothetical protein